VPYRVSVHREEVLRLDEGFALTRSVAPEDSPALGRRLLDLRLGDPALGVVETEESGAPDRTASAP